MVRAWGLFTSILLLAVFVGCSRKDPLPPTARAIEAPKVEEFTAPPKPVSSDPKAVAILTEALKAHTGGDLKKLEAFKTCTFTRTGVVITGVPGGIPSTWMVDLAWPNRYRMRFRLEQPGVTQSVAFGTDPKPWRFPSLAGNPQDRQEMDEPSTADMRSQLNEDTIGLLFPLADADVIAAMAPPTTVGPAAVDVLHLWSPTFKYILAYFDQKTHLLVRFTYEGREQGKPIEKTITYGKHEPFLGVQLPVEMEASVPARVMGRWSKFSIEPVTTFAAGTFEKP